METEQILVHKDDGGKTHIKSYVQIRGSIPLIWKQIPSLSYEPPVLLLDSGCGKR